MLVSRRIMDEGKGVSTDKLLGLPHVLARLQLPEDIEGVHLGDGNGQDGQQHGD